MLWVALVLALAYSLPFGSLPPVIEMITLGTVAICAILASRSNVTGHFLMPTLLLTILILAAGVLRKSQYTRSVYTGDTLLTAVRMKGELMVDEVLKRKEQSITLRCTSISLCSMDTSAEPVCLSDKFILIQIRLPDSLLFFPGDRFIAEGWVSALSPPPNPHAFDLRQYYHTLGIRHRLNTNGSQVIPLSQVGISLMRFPAMWQFKLSSIVHHYTSTEVAQLTNALVWGDRSDMDQEVIDAFALSGAMHVLSVSGMHVAIIYSILYLLLGQPGRGTYKKRITRLTIYIFAISLYVVLTGASAAVVRAGWMIVLFITGKAMGWNTQTWNILGFSACVMLWVDPFVLHNIGFQLSYLAMAGLLLCTRPVSRLMSFKNKLLQWAWEVTAVSIAAQIFILPLLLSYFHQFPLTFALSSLVAAPAGYLIIFGALLNVMLSIFDLTLFWPILDKAGAAFILSMKWLAELNPLMQYAMPRLTAYSLMLFPLLYTISLMYSWRRARQLAWLCGAVTILSLFAHRTIQWNRDEFIIYHTYNGILADIIMDGQCYTIRDTSVTPTAEKFAAHGYRSYRDIIRILPTENNMEWQTPRGTIKDHAVTLPTAGILFYSPSAYLMDSKARYTHVVVLDCTDHKKVITDLKNIHPEIVILPAHLRGYGKYAISSFAEKAGIAVHDINQQGYYRLWL